MRIFTLIFYAAVLLSGMLFSIETPACTSVIVTSKASADGRPLLWKHRDTGVLDNRLEHFDGPLYSFTGLVNSSGVSAGSAGENDREVWIGANVAGFSIMNTASYNIKDDNVPQSMMDREGILIYKALGICKDLSDFEVLLDTLKRPMGVEANFGVIDSYGGAAYYEVNNHSWVKYDLNDPEVAPDGYMVVTNFSFSGRRDDVKGYERYLTASAIFMEAASEGVRFTPEFIIDSLSRSFRHEFMGVDYVRDLSRMKASGIMTEGIVPDQDFIPRRSTSASVVIQGVKKGEDPLFTVLWTVLGYPLCSVAVPVPVSHGDHIPPYMKSSEVSLNSSMCDMALAIKDTYVFRFVTSSGRAYIDIESVLEGRDGAPSMVSCCSRAETRIRGLFRCIYDDFVSGRIDSREYICRYESLSSGFLGAYMDEFKYLIAHLPKNH